MRMVWRSLGWAIVAIGTLLVLASAASAGTSFWAAPMVSGQTTYTFTNLDDVPNPVVVMTKQGEAHRTTVPASSTATWTAQSSEAGLQNDALQTFTALATNESL